MSGSAEGGMQAQQCSSRCKIEVSLTEGGKEGKSKLIESNKYFESKICGLCEKGGIGISDSGGKE